MKVLIERLKQIEHGFKHIVEAGDELLEDSTLNHFGMALALLDDESYQGRMLATHMLGQLSANDMKALDLLLTKVAADPNWRVQEMLAKALDHYCRMLGYGRVLGSIQQWITNDHPNVRRAVTEGLRIWTSRPYFKDHPLEAIQLIARNRAHESEYLRKSVGNALRDIARKFPDLVKSEVANWDLADRRVAFTSKLVASR
ncbi:hypothetical protein J2Y45_003185 [Dyadobacter sp. BE34]|uniref:DNA alkylation repair enzyme n=1 Tax=Dyadobacter fermentans TaxID=94254 RepID=A0ABU1QXV4_9BACT|nr:MULTISPECIES: HEAT repeat domain-containing protein [Dyadobacter]MDR6805993.1 hypothetical protein [Dyadobacter fermentans]MDR7043733.1 hypothetical protein [Dyadobacter sp. BE242]MDR7198045.1 hypothetical protein [Dyadobacter sp. BE34]MDR7216007.1 hypothetical protein [Dyadobacter sp. BE31]MDR7264467.1 hypothetical protein [Dyadobacter sp. BE32]